MAKRTKGQVAVPYFGTGGADLLPLRRGSLLVVRFDTEAIKTGQTNPSEIIRLLNRGVEVHACRNLHAKVFVFGDTAVIASSNVSRSAANHLIEAGLATSSPALVSASRRFVESLRGDPIGLEFARRMKKLYRPPRGGRIQRGAGPTAGAPLHSRMWAVPLVRGSFEEEDRLQRDEAREAAKRRRENPRATRIEDFLWTGDSFLDRLHLGHRVVMVTDEANGKRMVSPPGRVLAIRKYRVRNQSRAIIALEVPKDARNRSIQRVVRSIGPTARILRKLASPREIRDGMLAMSLARMWSS
ncbi:MAG: hypothetical protein QN157_08965 [Armatimonadota bacterium]|nr:hypothetical protein [Armatimonadota bacterium]